MTIITSGGGNRYAVLLKNSRYEVGVLPVLQMVSHNVCFRIRIRVQAFDEHLNSDDMPKSLLANWHGKSNNTLRAVYFYNPDINITKVGKYTHEVVAKGVAEAMPGIFNEDVAVSLEDKVDDFMAEFSGLVSAELASIYPPKQLGGKSGLMSGSAFAAMVESAEVDVPHNPLAEAPHPDEDDDDNAVPLGGSTD